MFVAATETTAKSSHERRTEMEIMNFQSITRVESWDGCRGEGVVKSRLMFTEYIEERHITVNCLMRKSEREKTSKESIRGSTSIKTFMDFSLKEKNVGQNVEDYNSAIKCDV